MSPLWPTDRLLRVCSNPFRLPHRRVSRCQLRLQLGFTPVWGIGIDFHERPPRPCATAKKPRDYAIVSVSAPHSIFKETQRLRQQKMPPKLSASNQGTRTIMHQPHGPTARAPFFCCTEVRNRLHPEGDQACKASTDTHDQPRTVDARAAMGISFTSPSHRCYQATGAHQGVTFRRLPGIDMSVLGAHLDLERRSTNKSLARTSLDRSKQQKSPAGIEPMTVRLRSARSAN